MLDEQENLVLMILGNFSHKTFSSRKHRSTSSISWGKNWVDPAVGGNLPQCYRASVVQENSSDHRKKSQKNTHCNWMALFEWNMEPETWIAVDGHEVSQRFKIYMRGSIYLRISTALHSNNPRHPRVAWSKAAGRHGTRFRQIFGHHYRWTPF